MKEKINFKIIKYFPDFLYLLGILLIPTGLFFILYLEDYFLGGMAILFGYLLFSAHYGFELDFKEKYYKEYISFLGVHFGSEKNYERINYIFINKNKTRQTFSSRVNSTTIITYEYDAYIKFNDDIKVHLKSFGNKNKLIKWFKNNFHDTDIQLLDHTDKELKPL